MTDLIIPVFPLDGVIFFPETDLPLNIFEERYLEMIDFALSKDRLIGMIQPSSKSKLYNYGCIGKINSFNETSDKRYIINLYGVSLFKIKKEIICENKFRIFKVEKNNYNLFNKIDKKKFDKSVFIEKFKIYSQISNVSVDIDSLYKIRSEDLIKIIAMICPFKSNEKQMLLESQNLNNLYSKICALFEFYSKENNNLSTLN